MASYIPVPIIEDDDRQALRELTRDVVTGIVDSARIQQFDDHESFDEQLYTGLAEAGLVALEADLEGSLASHVSQTVVLEELGATVTSMAVTFVVQYMGVTLLTQHGSEEQRRLVLDPLLKGEQRIAFALSEPGGGTDVARVMNTRARQEASGDWVLTGSKLWISGADSCGMMIVLARTAEAQRSAIDGITMFLVPRDTPGISVNVLDTIGIHGLSTCEVGFDDVRLPATAVLGEAEKGFRQVLATLNGERINAAAVALGIARGAHDAALEYSRERVAFGRQIGGFQVLQHGLVDDAVGIELVRGLVQRAGAAADHDDSGAEALTAMAKLAASDLATNVTDRGMRLMGGSGLSKEYPMQRFFRDARLYTFAPLTNEMTRNYLGEHYLKLPRSY